MPTIRIRASAIPLWHGVEVRASVAMMLYAGVAFASSVMAVALWERTPLGSALEEMLTGAQALLVHEAPVAPPAPARTLLGTGAGLVVRLPGFAGAATRLPASAPGGALREPERRVDGGQTVDEALPASELLDEPTVGPADVPREGGGGGYDTVTAAPPAVRPRAARTVPTSGTPSVPAATRVPVTTVAESAEPAAAAPAPIVGQGAFGVSEATARPSPMAEPAREEEETPPFERPTGRARLTREERALLRADAQEPPEDHKAAKAGRGSGGRDIKRSAEGAGEVTARRDTALDSARENARNGVEHVAQASVPAPSTPLPVASPAATPSPVPEPARATATQRAQPSSAPVHIAPPAGSIDDRGGARDGVGPGSAASTGKAKEAGHVVSPPQAVESMGSSRKVSEPSDARSAATTSTPQEGTREAISARAAR